MAEWKSIPCWPNYIASDEGEIAREDTNRTNNRVDNLHWVTQAENMRNPNTLAKRRK